MSQERNQIRVFAGAYIVIIGLLALMDNMGWNGMGHLLNLWPLVFLGFGALKLRHAQNEKSRIIAGILMLAGVIITLENFGKLDIAWNKWWPAVLVIVGISVALRGWRDRNGSNDGREVLSPNSGSIDVNAIMSGHSLKSDIQDFRGGSITAVMGGVELDLRQASIISEARISVFVMWGGISMKVPADWSIVMNGTPILGGMQDETIPPMQPQKRLVIEGEVIMGGLEIKN
jgi:predicted membrane protein